MSGFHPSAQRRFDEQAAEVLARAAAETSQQRSEQPAFFPDVPIKGHIGEDDIQGPLTGSRCSADGDEIERWAATREGQVIFEGDAYLELAKLAGAMHRVAFMRDSVSFKSLLGWLTEWMLYRRIGREVEELTAFVSQKRADSVQHYRCMVPLCEPFIESAFHVGETLLEPLRKDELADWFTLPSDVREEHRQLAEQRMEKLRSTLQARTVVVVELEAEHDRAADVAWSRAGIMSSILRILSKGMFFPKAGSNCVPLGLAVSPRRQLMTLHPNGFRGWSEALLDPELMGNWSLDREMIARDLPYLNAMAGLADADEPTDFQRDALRALLLYSRVGLSREVPEKLVHLFAALESLLLRSETEPIQSAISERVAFVVGGTPAERAAIAGTTKEVYGLRSRFVHHGRSPERREHLDAVKILLRHSWAFFYQVVAHSGRYATKDAFLDALEKRKWQ